MNSESYDALLTVLKKMDSYSVAELCSLFEGLMASIGLDLEHEFGCQRDDKFDMVCNLFRELVTGLPPFGKIEGGCI